MGLFSKLGKVLGGDGGKKVEGFEKELETLSQDSRLHARYPILNDSIARLELDGEPVGTVKNISYGGIAVCFQAPPGSGRALPTKLPPSVTGRLHLLDQSVPFRLSMIRTVAEGPHALIAGFTFVHDTAETLVFLRGLIEPLRCGTSMIELSPSVRHERYKGTEWTCLRGDGPTDIVLKAGARGELVEALLTFRMGDSYCEVSYQQGRIATAKMTEKPGDILPNASHRVTANADLEKTILRQAVYLLTCVPESIRPLALPMMEQALRGLGVEHRSVA